MLSVGLARAGQHIKGDALLKMHLHLTHMKHPCHHEPHPPSNDPTILPLARQRLACLLINFHWLLPLPPFSLTACLPVTTRRTAFGPCQIHLNHLPFCSNLLLQPASVALIGGT